VQVVAIDPSAAFRKELRMWLPRTAVAADHFHLVSLANAATAKEELEILVEAAGQPETNKLYRTVCRWWNEIEVLIVTGATTGKVEASNTGIKHIKRTARGYRNPGNYKSVILMRSAVRTAA
jgi:transposase